MDKEVKKVVYNIKVGKAQVAPDAPSHVSGVKQGNEPGGLDKQSGIRPAGPDKAVADSRRSTGVSPEAANPIDPDMPNLTPA